MPQTRLRESSAVGMPRNRWQSALLDERFWVILFVVAILSLSIAAILLVCVSYYILPKV